MSTFFAPLENRAPYVKLVAFGGASSGKTWFLAAVAIGLWRRLNTKAPVGFLDTEEAAVHTLPLFKAAGVPVVHRGTRRPEDLVEAMRLTRAGELALLVGDSWTHFWESFSLQWAADHGVKSRPLSPTERGDMKSDWRRLVSEPFRADPCHYLIAGRASADYGSEVDDDTGRRESFQAGLRMRSEGDTTYEGGLVVRLERREREAGKGAYRVGFVEKDRTGAIDGHVLNLDRKLAGPCWEEIAPAVERLLANAAAPAPLSTVAPLALAGASDFQRSRDDAAKKGLLLEEIESWLALAFPGFGKEAVAGRAEILTKVFRSPAPGFAKALRLQELEVRHEELAIALKTLGKEAPSAFIDTACGPGNSHGPEPISGPGMGTGPQASLAEAIGEDLPTFQTGGGAQSLTRNPSPPSVVSPHQISERQGEPGTSKKHEEAGSGGARGHGEPHGAGVSAVASVPVLSDSSNSEGSVSPKKPAVVESVPRPLEGAVPLKVTPSESEDESAGCGSAGPGGDKATGPAPGTFSVSPRGPFGRPCFFCNKETPGEGRYVMAPNPIGALAEGLHPCFVDCTGARHVEVPDPDAEDCFLPIVLAPHECEDVCGPCGEREIATDADEAEHPDIDDGEEAYKGGEDGEDDEESEERPTGTGIPADGSRPVRKVVGAEGHSDRTTVAVPTTTPPAAPLSLWSPCSETLSRRHWISGHDGMRCAACGERCRPEDSHALTETGFTADLKPASERGGFLTETERERIEASAPKDQAPTPPYGSPKAPTLSLEDVLDRIGRGPRPETYARSLVLEVKSGPGPCGVWREIVELAGVEHGHDTVQRLYVHVGGAFTKGSKPKRKGLTGAQVVELLSLLPAKERTPGSDVPVQAATSSLGHAARPW